MERLTERNEYGSAYVPACFSDDGCRGFGASEKCNNCPHNAARIDKLAEYEDMHETGRMINVDPVIHRLQKRIDDFLNLHPERKGCEEVVVVEEFIHTLEIEADEQNKDK